MNDKNSIKNLLNKTADYLKGKQISSFQLDSELLISSVLKYSKTQIYANYFNNIKAQEINKLEKLLMRRASHEPIVYILGEKEFYGLRFIVNQDVLIPRPETEFIIHAVTKYNLDNKKILDMGTGCGNIGITLKTIFNN
jgi:release factor glutamine methyltransferase